MSEALHLTITTPMELLVDEPSARALRAGTIRITEAKALMRSYQHGLNGYTYLEEES